MKTLTLARRIGALASWFGPSLLVFGAETTFGSRDFFPNPPAPQTAYAPYGNAGNLPVSVPEMDEKFNEGNIDIDAPHQGQTPENGEISVAEQMGGTSQQINEVQRTPDLFLNQLLFGQRFEQVMREKEEKINLLENIINTQNQQLEQAREENRELVASNLKMMQSRIQYEKEIRRLLQQLRSSRNTLLEVLQVLESRISVSVQELSQQVDGQVLSEVHQEPLTADFIQKELSSLVPDESRSSFQTPLAMLSDFALWEQELATIQALCKDTLDQTQAILAKYDEEEDLR